MPHCCPLLTCSALSPSPQATRWAWAARASGGPSDSGSSPDGAPSDVPLLSPEEVSEIWGAQAESGSPPPPAEQSALRQALLATVPAMEDIDLVLSLRAWSECIQSGWQPDRNADVQLALAFNLALQTALPDMQPHLVAPAMSSWGLSSLPMNDALEARMAEALQRVMAEGDASEVAWGLYAYAVHLQGPLDEQLWEAVQAGVLRSVHSMDAQELTGLSQALAAGGLGVTPRMAEEIRRAADKLGMEVRSREP
ncbi:hypothetical protein COHA_001294 [Chlorella ohadii]|uniref:Uncharacterized protein n=1 Tax=Chlorella ohadii TaxID=2649997 RepID=A0AAD5DVN5_9CHLO|nr:hypothetical protein COHA_001294 [Chlorella ohadii]